MKTKPVIGQQLWVLPLRRKDSELIPANVTKVGRKYFTVSVNGKWAFELEFRIEDWRENTEFQATHAAYSSPEELENEKETDAILVELRKFFAYTRPTTLSLESLRTIESLCFPNNSGNEHT